MVVFLRMFASRSNRLLGLVFLLILPGLFWGLPSAISPQDDAPFPLGPLFFFAEYSKSHLDIIYPAFHQLLLVPLYAIAFGVYWLAGGISHLSSTWPYGLRNVSAFFSVLLILTNLVSAIMAVLLLRACFPFVERSRKWLWFALLIIGTNGVFVYYARVGNLDLPYNFWWALTLVGLWHYLIAGSPARTSLVPAGITAALAAGSKDQAAGLIIGAGFLLLLFAPAASASLRDRIRNAFIFSLTVVVVYFIFAILPQPIRWWNHARFVTSPHAPTQIPFSAAGELQIFWVTLQQLRNVFGISLLALAVLGAVYLFRSGRGLEFWILTLPLIGYYVVIIAKTRVAYPRFMLPFIFPMVVLVTHGVAWVADRFENRNARVAWSAILCLYIGFNFVISYLPVTYAQVFDLKRQLAKELPSLLPTGSGLLISHMESYEYPNSEVYERYRLMRLPHEPIVPTSRHTESLFLPLDNEVGYYLWGTGTAGLPSNTPMPPMPLQGELVKQWKYPDWVRNGVLVPCILEFSLYRRTAPLPLDYVPAPFVVSGVQ
jgi:hypothetical protein